MRLHTLAPAKVNLLLRVGPLRDDGYHDLLSLMVPLDLADEVEVAVSPRAGPVRCRAPGHRELDGPENLAARAAEAFRRRLGVDRGISIRIEKRIPITAGLGGGSSDAAAVLRCLARAFPEATADLLAELAASVGSDVPFFLGPGPAWVRGRGERLAPAAVARLHLVLLHPVDPALAIRAGEAYRWLDEDRADRPPRPLPRRAPAWTPAHLGNDLEPGCIARRPALGGLRGLLVGAGASAVALSGSGPTVFGLFPDRAAARRAAAAIDAVEGGRVRVLAARSVEQPARVSPWRSPRSASSRSTRSG